MLQQPVCPPPSQPYPFPWPFKRPDFYPPEILWTQKDCRNDLSVSTSDMNKSRLSMKRTIRHDDGRHISDDEWKAIRQSAVLVARTFLDPLDPQGILSAGQPCKKNFYKNNFWNKWNRALSKLEVVTPLTSFCAGTWKADLTLGSVLQDTTLLKNPAPGPPSRSLTPSSLAPSRVHSTSSHMPPPPLFPPVPGLPVLLLLPAL